MERVHSRWPAALLALLAVGCASLPPLERTASFGLSSTNDTRLGRAVHPHVESNPGKNGVHALAIPSDAFAARVLLARAAERSLDAQYYIWHDDQTGLLLFESLWQAADRGVRVRLLLDDNSTRGLDSTIAALDAHPNIEVRLYNPMLHRDARSMDFITDFARVNRRMHNKSFVVDNQVAVVGGRNVGNEYFGAGGGVVFADLDVIVVGAAVRDVSRAFDTYWNSDSAYPAASILRATAPEGSTALRARFAATHADEQSQQYADVVRNTSILRQLMAGELAFEWTDVAVLYDDPAKTLDDAGRAEILLLTQLLSVMGTPQKSFDLISPYFVPGANGTEALVALARRGVVVRILTNSLDSTDVVAVHAGYAKRRRDLLEAGVRLYELKSSVARDDPAEKAKLGISSSSSLHAKTFAVDGKRIFVGSFNFDPRSAHLNTEMGVVIESPVLAERLAGQFDTTIPLLAYEVRMTADGSLEWIDRSAAGVTRYSTEPGGSPMVRAWLMLLSLMPIDWLL